MSQAGAWSFGVTAGSLTAPCALFTELKLFFGRRRRAPLVTWPNQRSYTNMCSNTIFLAELRSCVKVSRGDRPGLSVPNKPDQWFL